MLDLNNAKVGDQLRTRTGQILTYDGRRYTGNYPHRVLYPGGGSGTRTNDGMTWVTHRDESTDIVEIIGTQTKYPSNKGKYVRSQQG